MPVWSESVKSLICIYLYISYFNFSLFLFYFVSFRVALEDEITQKDQTISVQNDQIQQLQEKLRLCEATGAEREQQLTDLQLGQSELQQRLSAELAQAKTNLGEREQTLEQVTGQCLCVAYVLLMCSYMFMHT